MGLFAAFGCAGCHDGKLVELEAKEGALHNLSLDEHTGQGLPGSTFVDMLVRRRQSHENHLPHGHILYSYCGSVSRLGNEVISPRLRSGP